MVGQCLVPMLVENEWLVYAFSRRPIRHDQAGVEWKQLQISGSRCGISANDLNTIPFWICVAPIWILPDYFPLLEAHGARRVIAISSTSSLTKSDSPDHTEVVVARMLSDGENRLLSWARSNGVDWVIFRPTLIYGFGLDQNISEIARLIRRLGFFPLAGRAMGMRQPVHAEDVANVCLSAIEKTKEIQHIYSLSGGETLAYREMIRRVFRALGCKPRLIEVPPWLFRLAVFFVRSLPRYRHWNVQMVERMNVNLVFDHDEASRDFHYSPRSFQLTSKDLPP